MRNTRLSIPAVLLAATLGLAACGGGDDGGDGGGEAAASGDAITVQTTEFEYDPASMTIPADTDVTVTLDNSEGAVEHDFTVEDTDDQVTAAPGQVTEGTVNLPAGDYTVYCSVPGHRESGMEASLTVE